MEYELKNFLACSGLQHLEAVMLENGMTIELLRHANENELSALTTRMVDKIKLRLALEKLSESKDIHDSSQQQFIDSEEDVALVVRSDTAGCYIKENDLIQIEDLPATSTPVYQDNFHTSNLSKEFSFKGLGDDLEFVLSPSPARSQESIQENLENDEVQSANTLHRLLQKETRGKTLLEKAKTQESLDSRDRSYIVKVVVEAELRSLDKVNHTIRRDVWQQWANVITDCFKGEPKALYYVPYHVLDGKIIQASGLIHNRLITHRRILSSGNKRKLSNSDSSDSGHSSMSNNSNHKQRVRPLPKEFTPSTKNISSLEDKLDWLRGSSSPHDTVISKWEATFPLWTKLLEQHTYSDYFNIFPALKLPNGHKLLTSDFETVYPGANKKFEERYPIIKLKLLTLLAERGESIKIDQAIIDLLELASVGEEQANVAAFLAIVSLLRQMPTISIPKKKVWKLSRDEVRNSFLPRVATAAEIESYCIQRQTFCESKGIPNQPFLLAVGPSWANVLQYEIVIDKGLRYQVPNICSAVMFTYNIYWALDCAYPRESEPCWMLLQRTIFQMASKYDIEGVPLRELIKQLDTK